MGVRNGRSRTVAGSMSVGLVFVWSDRPDGLEGEIVRGRLPGNLGPRVLGAELHPLALPQRQRGDDLARDETGERILDVIVSGSRDQALTELIRGAGVPAEPRGAGAAVFLPQRVQFASQRPLAVQPLSRWTPRESEIDPAHLGTKTRIGVGAVQRRATELHVGGARQLPEVQQVQEVRRPAGAPEQLRIALAARDLRGDLVGSEPAERPIQRDAGTGQPVVSEIGPEGDGVFGLREGVQVPAIQLAELLAELPDVEPDVSWQPGPVCVPLFDADIAVLKAHENLGARVGIERRLKADFELSRVEVLALDALEARASAYIARGADFRIELRLAALAADEFRGPGGVGLHLCRVRARRDRGGGAQGGERRVGRRLGRRGMDGPGAPAVAPGPERSDLGPR